MLAVLPNNAPDGVNKSLGLIKALGKKGFEFLLGDEDISLILDFLLILLLVKQGGILEECGDK